MRLNTDRMDERRGCNLQVDQEADDETKDWLDNMMSNSVSVKKWSGLPDKPPLSETHKSLLRRQQSENRFMRKTLILKTGTPDITEEASANAFCMHADEDTLIPPLQFAICPVCDLVSLFNARACRAHQCLQEKAKAVSKPSRRFGL